MDSNINQIEGKMMKKITKITQSALAVIILTTVTFNVSAALSTNAVLNFLAAPTAGYVLPESGSWFSMDYSLSNVDDVPPIAYTPISSFDGIIIDQVQNADGSHDGLPGCVDGVNSCNNTGEFPSIDNPWVFFQRTGMHGTNVNGVSVVTDDGAGNVTLDMSGWTVDWDGGEVGMGHGADAMMTCDDVCGDGDTYTLDYAASVPSGPFTGVPYALHLEGTISAVPVPAAVWLFGSGLLGLVGVARRRQLA